MQYVQSSELYRGKVLNIRYSDNYKNKLLEQLQCNWTHWLTLITTQHNSGNPSKVNWNPNTIKCTLPLKTLWKSTPHYKFLVTMLVFITPKIKWHLARLYWRAYELPRTLCHSFDVCSRLCHGQSSRFLYPLSPLHF